MSEIDLSLLDDFIEEAVEHLDEMEANLLKLQAGEDSKDICNDIFRHIHSIKGAGQFVGLDRVSGLTHRMEDLLDKLRQGEMDVTPSIIDVLMAGRDRIQMLVTELQKTQTEQSSVEDLVILLNAHLAGEDNPIALQPQSVDEDTEPQEEPVDYEWQDAEIVVEPPSSYLEEDDSFFEAASDDLVDMADIQAELRYNEEQDEELFGIFMQHLQDRIGVLKMLAGALQVSDEPNEIYEELQQQLSRLRSAANYMGFAHMVGFYDKWLKSIENAVAEQTRGEPAAREFVGEHLHILQTLLEQLDDATDLPTLQHTEEAVEAKATKEPIAPTMEAQGEDIQAENFSAEDFKAEEFKAEEFTAENFNTEEADDLDNFVSDAVRQLDVMDQALGNLRDAPGDSASLETLFRTSHTLKGAAQFVGIPKLAAVAGRMENMLYPLQESGITNTEQQILLNLGYATLLQLIEELEQGRREETDVDSLVARFDQYSEPAGASGGDSTELTSEMPESHTPQEENDQELLEIFLNQLNELFAEIRHATNAFVQSGDGPIFLASAQDVLTRLGSAASYMGYEALYQLYREWRDRLDSMVGRPGADTQAVSGLVDDYIRRALAIATGSDDIESMLPAAAEPVKPQPVVAASEAPKSSKPQPTVASSESLDAVVASAAEVEIPSAKSEDDAHFIRLTQALESSFDPVEQQEYETLHGVFEEMLNHNGGVEKQPPVKQPPVPPVVRESAKTAPATKKRPAVKKQVVSPNAEKPVQQAQKPKTPKPSPDDQVKKKAETDKPSLIKKPVAQVKKKSIRVESERIDTLMNQVGELVVDRSYFMQLFNEMNDLQRHLKDDLGVDKKKLKNVRAFSTRLNEAITSLTRTSNELQEGVMKVRMLPISQLFSRYPRLIHDLTNGTKKKVRLELRGEDTELDKMIVEELSDPLIHIVRNAIDHGLEAVDERRRQGKPEEGILLVEAYQEGNHIVVEVVDDGRGIDIERLKAKALEKRLYSRDELERMSQRELMRLIMQPGFSTADKVSRTSGRGVGMDVVKKNIERLNGTIEIASKPGVETRMRLKIPLTLAIIQALQVRVADRSFTIPLSNIMETLNIQGMGTSMIEGTEVMQLRGRTLPIFRLGDMFDLKYRDENNMPFLVVVSSGTEEVGLVVDELLGQDEVVIKPLAEFVQEQSGFSGATILGDGRISLILDVTEMINIVAARQMAKQQGLMRRRKLEAKGAADSITRPLQ